MTRLGSNTFESNCSNDARPLAVMIGAHLAAFAVNGVALGAEVLEDALTGDGVADVLAQILAHFGDDLFAFGVSLFANFAERLFDRPERFAVVALQNLSQVIGVEHALGKLVGEHRVEKFPRPRLALHDQIDRQRLQFGRELRVFGENDIGELRVVDAAQRGENARRQNRSRRRTAPRATSSSNAGSRNAISASSACRRVAPARPAKPVRGALRPSRSSPSRAAPRAVAR